MKPAIHFQYLPSIYTTLTELVGTGKHDLRPILHTDTALIVINLGPDPATQTMPCIIHSLRPNHSHKVKFRFLRFTFIKLSWIRVS